MPRRKRPRATRATTSASSEAARLQLDRGSSASQPRVSDSALRGDEVVDPLQQFDDLTQVAADREDGARALFADSRLRLVAAVDALMRRAQAAGALRAALAADEVLMALYGICYSHDGPGWQARVTRLVDVFIDGLATRS